jgi:uncharacterized protein
MRFIRRPWRRAAPRAAAAFLALVLASCQSATSDHHPEFIDAVKAGQLEAARTMLDRGTPVATRDKKHAATALMWAAHEGHVELVQLLLDRGARIDERKHSGETALWFAAQQGHAGAAELLLQRGADPNAQDGEGVTPLMVARTNGHEAVADLLRRAGAVE